MSESGERRREIAWSDPREILQAGRGLSGLELFEKMKRGEIPTPPIANLTGQTIEEVGLGRIVMGLTPAEFMYNPIGSVHGGIIATLLDSVMGCAVHSTLVPGRAYSTLELKVNYIRAVTIQTGFVRSEGWTTHVGRRSAVAEAKMIDSAGKLYAIASSTCLVFDL